MGPSLCRAGLRFCVKPRGVLHISAPVAHSDESTPEGGMGK